MHFYKLVGSNFLNAPKTRAEAQSLTEKGIFMRLLWYTHKGTIPMFLVGTRVVRVSQPIKKCPNYGYLQAFQLT